MMTEVHLIDHKGDYWELVYANAAIRYLHNGMVYWKAWWYAPTRPEELKNYTEVPLPIFTDWWEETYEHGNG